MEKPTTKTMGINMEKEMTAEFERRAESRHLSPGKYCKIILTQWLASSKKLKLEER